MLFLFLLGIFALVVAAVLFGVAMRDLRPLGGESWRRFHHFWWGTLAVAIGGLAWADGMGWPGAVLSLVGGLVALDDGHQHAVQANTHNLAYRSYLHRWFYRVFPSLARY